ncbi:hypothetical protein SCLCIDRAFT_1224612 [Scleroderma citrinum Foug A]|uniref:Uncharacterized protein n=1 Tax=Scleroderma citrinum Foug A TaxID=1036808 RepID=A0A0C3D5E9_9AGAM|nr:hypothetical protein SCLCIDRAFT_1224612 [Scleroderma citrinum Foug A]
MRRKRMKTGGNKLVAERDVEGENGNGEQSGVVGTTSSDNIDSIRVEEALLAVVDEVKGCKMKTYQRAERSYEDNGC